MNEPITYEHEQRLVARRWEFRNRFKVYSFYQIYKLTVVYVVAFSLIIYTQIIDWGIISMLVAAYVGVIWLALKFIQE